MENEDIIEDKPLHPNSWAGYQKLLEDERLRNLAEKEVKDES